MALGQAIKEARIRKGLTRESLAEQVHVSISHLANIENKNKCPGFQLFYRLITFFNISVDEYFYPDEKSGRSTELQVMNMVKSCDEGELYILSNTIKAMEEAKSKTKYEKKL